MITIVQMPVESMYQISGVYHPPLALAQLSACLKKENYFVKCLDISIELYKIRQEKYKNVWAIENRSFWHNEEYVLNFFKDNEVVINDYVDKIIGFGSKIVFFSIDPTSKLSSLEFAKLLKLKNKNIKIIFYGSLFFIFHREIIEGILNSGNVDIVIYGEYENTAIEVVKFFLEEKYKINLEEIKGICYKGEDNKIVCNSDRELIKNLDSLPYLDFSELNFNNYDPPGHLINTLTIETSRGCVFDCVFCGQRAYWKGYRTMTGKRIYEEIKYHIKNYPNIEQIEFLDLVFNGNMKTLLEFCDLIIREPIKENLRWHANMIIRPEMTEYVCRRLKKSGCWHITYGIESGSQKVLDKMKKRYKISDAEIVIKNTHNSGIVVTCNFMFGFPGETEEDFQLTLDFVRKNAEYIDILYPSNTCFTIEPFSYLSNHLNEFEVVPSEVHGQYWESVDGKNTYPERLRRYEKFITVASSLGIKIGSGLQTSIEQEKYMKLGEYYESKKDFKKAKEYYEKYLELDPKNMVVVNKLKFINSNYESIIF